VESAPRLLYQVYCELVLPIPPELEHLRTPDSGDTGHSVPMPSVDDTVMSYQSSSADLRPAQTAKHHPRYSGLSLICQRCFSRVSVSRC